MKLTVFTSNQPRHLSLIESLASISEELFAVQECNTVFPGLVEDFYKRSEIMRQYFQRVISAESHVFGRPRFSPPSVRTLPIKSGDLNRLEMQVLAPALKSDLYVVFGSSFIKGDLCDFLVSRNAYNIHMGVSPYYRGSSCNFWALYDRKPEYVGATIHMLSKGLDSGPMLFHAFPLAQGETDPFVIGMLAVKSAHEGLVHYISTGKIREMEPVAQDKTLEIRYTRNRDFTDDVASCYLAKLPDRDEILEGIRRRDTQKFLRPFVH